MNKINQYRTELQSLTEWDAYLLANSGLPGPRGNLELAHAAAQCGTRAQFENWITWDAERAPVNSPQEFLAFCGVLGMGNYLPTGDAAALAHVRRAANDPRWRTREAAAMALQMWGDACMKNLLTEMRIWVTGTRLEQRAVTAGLCEPRLLSSEDIVRQVLALLEQISRSLPAAPDRRSDAFISLRKTLGYGWSVAVAACPAVGKPWLEQWLTESDPDLRWILRENLKKDRLVRMDSVWHDELHAKIG